MSSSSSGPVDFDSLITWIANKVAAILGLVIPDTLDIGAGGRNVPDTTFSWFSSLLKVSRSMGPGEAGVDKDLADVFLAQHGASISSTTKYVHPSGSDANGGASWRDAYLTLAKALRTSACGDIYVWPGTYDLSDFRYTDTSGGSPKRVIAPFGNVILRNVGAAPSSKTWTLDGGFGGQWNACLTDATRIPVRVLKKDVLTPDGDPLPMPKFANRAAMGAGSNFGWCYEAVAQTLTVTTNGTNTVTCASTLNLCVGMTLSGHADVTGRTVTAVTTNTSFVMDGVAAGSHAGISITASGNVICIKESMSASVESNKANYDIVYQDSVSGNRVLLLSSTSYWENITLYGYFSVLIQAGQATPILYAKNCKLFYGDSSAFLVEGGNCYHQGCIAGYNNADGANYNLTSGVTPHAVEINFTTRWCGDYFTWGNPATLNPVSSAENKNGSSNHDGIVVRVNGVHTNPFGPVIADSGYVWNLGVEAGHSALTPNTYPTSIRVGFYVDGSAGVGGHAWYDGCYGHGCDYGFEANSVVANVYNCNGTQITASGGSFVAFAPT